VSAEIFQDLATCLTMDCQFLMKQKVMDYSLLVAIEHIDPSRHQNTTELPVARDRLSCGILAYDALEKRLCRYYFGIIDFLQMYNYLKMTERVKNVLVYTTKASHHSCIEPKAYGERFVKFCLSNVFYQMEDFFESACFTHTGRGGRVLTCVKEEHFSPNRQPNTAGVGWETATSHSKAHTT